MYYFISYKLFYVFNTPFHYKQTSFAHFAIVAKDCLFWLNIAGIARHRGFASLTYSKSQSRIVVTSAAAHGHIVKTVKKVTTYMVGTVKWQNTSSSERSRWKIAETRQSLFRKSAWSGYAHKMCAVDSNTKRLYSNEMSDRATHFTVFMIMNCPVEQQILGAYGSIVDSRRTFARVSLYLNYSFRKLRMPSTL